MKKKKKKKKIYERESNSENIIFESMEIKFVLYALRSLRQTIHVSLFCT